MSNQSSQRNPAIDLLRGMTVCFMIIVNTGGSGAEPYALLQHAEWHGFTPTDLVFPTFLFVVGNALVFTLPKMETMDDRAATLKILKRTAIIFLLGYLMYWFPFVQADANGAWSMKPVGQTRILGVLQRIALCYGISALLLRRLPEKTMWTVIAVILSGYWALMAMGGDYTLEGNLVRKIDRSLLGDAHLYHGDNIAFDPEGLLSTLPAVGNVIIGYFAAIHIKRHGNNYKTVADLLVAAIMLMVVAYLWDQLFPVNKKLWTSSFTLLTSGLSMAMLGLLIHLTEINKYKAGAGFFGIFGRNPLFIYLLSELIAILMWSIPVGNRSVYEWVNELLFQQMLPGSSGSLLFALTVMFTCWVAGWWLDRRRIYIRV
jgi:predicted acyltransferase